MPTFVKKRFKKGTSPRIGVLFSLRPVGDPFAGAHRKDGSRGDVPVVLAVPRFVQMKLPIQPFLTEDPEGGAHAN